MLRRGPHLLLVVALALLASDAKASVTVEAPANWNSGSAADQAAHQMVARWRTSLSGSVAGVYASTGADDFIETMAVIEREGAMPAEVVDDSDAAARWLDAEVAEITGGAAAEEMGWSRSERAPAGYAFAKYTLDGQRLLVLAVPDGERTTFVLMTALAAEDLFYGPIFDEIQASVSGGSAPIHPYDVAGLRTWNFIGWVVGLIAVYGASIAIFSERQGDHRRVGRMSAFILSGLAALVAIAVYVSLGDDGVALAAIGSSATTLAAEVFGVGAAMAGVAFVGGQMLESGEQRVRSAPAQANLSARLQAAEAEREQAED